MAATCATCCSYNAKECSQLAGWTGQIANHQDATSGLCTMGMPSNSPWDVARQLADAAQLSNVLARLAADDWDRAVIYHYPETRERALRWLAIHTLHEAQHHLHDIRCQI
jgi:DinB superfamily